MEVTYEATKPGFSFCVYCLLYVVVYFAMEYICFYLLGFSFQYLVTRLAGKNVSEMTHFVSGGM